jgi:hypothetical protein
MELSQAWLFWAVFFLRLELGGLCLWFDAYLGKTRFMGDIGDWWKLRSQRLPHPFGDLRE